MNTEKITIITAAAVLVELMTNKISNPIKARNAIPKIRFWDVFNFSIMPFLIPHIFKMGLRPKPHSLQQAKPASDVTM